MLERDEDGPAACHFARCVTNTPFLYSRGEIVPTAAPGTGTSCARTSIATGATASFSAGRSSFTEILVVRSESPLKLFSVHVTLVTASRLAQSTASLSGRNCQG